MNNHPQASRPILDCRCRVPRCRSCFACARCGCDHDGLSVEEKFSKGEGQPFTRQGREAGNLTGSERTLGGRAKSSEKPLLQDAGREGGKVSVSDVLDTVGFPPVEDTGEELKRKFMDLMKHLSEWIQRNSIDSTIGPENADINYALQEGTYKGPSFEEVWELAEASSDACQKVRAVVNAIDCFIQETLSFERIIHQWLEAGHPAEAISQGQDVGPLMGNLNRKHNILRALSFLACKNSSCVERVEKAFLEIRQYELDRFMYDRALSSKKYEREIDCIIKKIDESDRVFFSELLGLPGCRQRANYLREYVVLQAIARSGCILENDPLNFIQSARTKEEYTKCLDSRAGKAVVVMDIKMTNEGMHSIVPWLSISRQGEIIAHNRDLSRIVRIKLGVPSLSMNIKGNLDDEHFNGIMEGITEKDIRSEVKVRFNCTNLHRGKGTISLETLKELARLLFERDLYRTFIPEMVEMSHLCIESRPAKRIWAKHLLDSISRFMPSLSKDLLDGNVQVNRVTNAIEELGYNFDEVLPYIARRLVRHTGENGLAIRDALGRVLIVKVNYCNAMVMQNLMTREEAASRDPVLLVLDDRTRISTSSLNKVLEWLPRELGTFEKRRLLGCLEHLKSRCYDESIIPYGEFSEPLLRELKLPEDIASKRNLLNAACCKTKFSSAEVHLSESNIGPAVGVTGEYSGQSEVRGSGGIYPVNLTSPLQHKSCEACNRSLMRLGKR